VLHLVLALSALHLVHLNSGSPDQQRTYVDSGERHLQAGLRGSIALLQQLDPTKFQPLYLSAVLACFCTFARGPAQNELMLLGGDDGALVAWFPMLRGVRSIAEKAGPDLLTTGELAAGKKNVGAGSFAVDSEPYGWSTT